MSGTCRQFLTAAMVLLAASAPATADVAGSILATEGSVANTGQSISTAIRNTAIDGADGAPGAQYIWGSVGGLSFDGRLDGDADNLTLGFDSAVSPGIRVGALIGRSSADIDTASGLTVETDTLYVGPYLVTRLGERGTFDSYFVFGRPDYSQTGGPDFDAIRILSGFGYSTNMVINGVDVDPFFRLDSSIERLPRRSIGGTVTGETTIGDTTAALGATARFGEVLGGNLTPSLTLAAEYNLINDGLGDSGSYLAPRLGLGVRSSGGAGTFNFDVTAAEVADDVDAISIDMSYTLNF